MAKTWFVVRYSWRGESFTLLQDFDTPDEAIAVADELRASKFAGVSVEMRSK